MNMKRPYFDLEASGERMRQIRKSRKLSVRDVVDYMGFESTQAVYKWESGKCFPQADNLVALAMLYEVSPAELLVCEGECSTASLSTIQTGEVNDSQSVVRQHKAA